MVDAEERRHRLRTVQALSVELERIRKVSIQATALGDTVIEDVIDGDWRNAERVAGGIIDGYGADQTLWESFILLVKTASAESKRLAAGVRPEGN